MPPNQAVRIVAVTAVTLFTLLADQLSISLSNPGAALLPLGVPYLIAAFALPTLVTSRAVAVLAVGYVLVLLADAADRSRVLRFQAVGEPALGMLLGGAISSLCALLVAGLAGVFTPGPTLTAARRSVGRGRCRWAIRRSTCGATCSSRWTAG